MKISKPIKCLLAVVFFIFLAAMIMGSSYQEGPVLDNSIIPGYYLFGFDSFKQDISEYIKDDCRYKRFKKTKSITRLDEMWLTVTKKESWDSFFDEKKRENLKLRWSGITVVRYYLDNKEETSDLAKLIMEGTGASGVSIPSSSKDSYEEWTEGGYRVEKIGDKCWSNKNSAYRKILMKGNGLDIFFTKGNIVVRVLGAGPENNPMNPLFIEKIAKAVENRL